VLRAIKAEKENRTIRVARDGSIERVPLSEGERDPPPNPWEQEPEK
jgi:hypothetical protein